MNRFTQNSDLNNLPDDPYAAVRVLRDELRRVGELANTAMDELSQYIRKSEPDNLGIESATKSAEPPVPVQSGPEKITLPELRPQDIEFGKPKTTPSAASRIITLRPCSYKISGGSNSEFTNADDVVVYVASDLSEQPIDEYGWDTSTILIFQRFPRYEYDSDESCNVHGVLLGSASNPHGTNDYDILYWDETDEEWKVLEFTSDDYKVLQRKSDYSLGWDWVRAH